MAKGFADWDGAKFIVLIVQARGSWERITQRRAMSFDAAADLFDELIHAAEQQGYRHVQMRHDAGEVVAQWPRGCSENRTSAY